MNRESTLGLFLIALVLGGVLLLTRRPATISRCATAPQENQSRGTIQLIPVQAEPRRYQNKEVRDIEWKDGLPVKIIITRDYAIT